MKKEFGVQKSKNSGDIWIFVQHREGEIEHETFGLIAEAKRINTDKGGEGRVTAVALGADLDPLIESLVTCGADKIVYISDDLLRRYHGELFSMVLKRIINKYCPSYFLMAQSAENADLSSRLAGLMETAVVSRAVDLRFDEEGRCVATRPVANGYLFESLVVKTQPCPIICFIPSVLSGSKIDNSKPAEIIKETPEIPSNDLMTKIVEVIEAVPEELDLNEADVIVAGGRGVGKDNSFNIIHELADAIGGTVGGTRPVIDWDLLPFECQIGQTGKTVFPRLIFACGISGANEFTAGMENARTVIAVNKDSNARIFQFADLGIIGDVHDVIPLLIERLRKKRES